MSFWSWLFRRPTPQTPAPRPTPPPAPIPPRTLRAIGLVVLVDGRPVTRYRAFLDDVPLPHRLDVDNGDGYGLWPEIAASLGATQLTIQADGYEPYSVHLDLPTGAVNTNIVLGRAPHAGEVPAPPLVSTHVDPSGLTLEALAHNLRGALWTVKGKFSYGPRPNREDNIFAPDYLELYPDDEKRRGLQLFADHGYNAAPVGPFVDGGYHGQYPAVDYSGRPDAYLDDVLQPVWDSGLRPVLFLKPDGWTLAQLRAFEPTFRSPRWQKLARIVVPGGWEPDMSLDEWVALLQWARDVFPRALIGIHMPGDHDAPGTHADVDRLGGTGALWAAVAPFVHLWLVQNMAFEDPSRNFANFVAQFDDRDPRSLHGRFRVGYAGWPRSSAWGGEQPIRVLAAEFASYWVYWHNRSEDEARAWGTAALRAGADGVLDGCER